MKPIAVDGSSDFLFSILMGIQHSHKSSGPDKQIVEFGCNQVVIVWNQTAKDNLPVELRHSLCLTVYEVKGLEFDDVILYNFFTDSAIGHDWKQLNEIQIEKELIAWINQDESNVSELIEEKEEDNIHPADVQMNRQSSTDPEITEKSTF